MALGKGTEPHDQELCQIGCRYEAEGEKRPWFEATRWTPQSGETTGQQTAVQVTQEFMLDKGVLGRKRYDWV